MGCELAIACIPLAEMNPDRIQRLHVIVDELDEEVMEEVTCCMDSEEHCADDVRRFLHEQVNLIAFSENRWRDVSHIRLPELPYRVLAAGGYTWGDSPSDLYEAFWVINDCEPIRKQLANWACQDKLQSTEPEP